MSETNRSFLLVPAGGAGEGIGHLTRCVRLAAKLGPRVTFLTSRMDSAARALLAGEIRHFPNPPRPAVLERLKAGRHWDLVLVDARRTTREELGTLMRHGLVVGLDEGGEGRAYAPYLIDALPVLPGVSSANLNSPAYLGLPERRQRKIRIPPRRALLSFGGEDRENLTQKLLEALLRDRIFAPENITVVEGPLFAARQWPAGPRVVRGALGLAGIFSDHDVLFTHFGVTAFEALATGLPVVLLNPGRYHDRLGAAAGLPSIGTRKPDMRALRNLLRSPERLLALAESFNDRLGKGRDRRLADICVSLSVQGSSACPICGRAGNSVIARFPEKTYRRCPRCGIAHLESFAPAEKRYGKSYFSTEYKAQYGRTYLEDFKSIKAASRVRVTIIRELLRSDVGGVVLDIGCAYGPFLDAAKDSGMPGYGVDVSADAVDYVRRNLRIPALCSAFEKVERRSLPRRISVVTLWYVIEHFKDTDLALRKAASLLPHGGVLAFSTPNGRGISARRGCARFLEDSPADHFTIFSPRGLRTLLAGYGLELRRIRVTGHHPERFPGTIGRAAQRSGRAFRIIAAVSRLLRLGDTFEAYAVKGDQ